MAAAEENENRQPASARRDEDAVIPADGTSTDGTDGSEQLTGDRAEAKRTGKDGKRRHPVRAFLRESAIVVVSALVLSLIIKTFLAQAFFIPSVSMEPTLMVGDRLVVNKLAPQVMDLERGDVVVFLDPGGWLDTEPHELNAAEQVLTWIGLLPEHADEHVIKRVIGTGGDHVTCCTDEGLISVNGEPITEPYVVPGAEPSERPFDVVVPENHLFVLGDNRPRSADSRAHAGAVGAGFVPVRNVVGRAFVITWPLDRIEWLSNPTETFADVPDP